MSDLHIDINNGYHHQLPDDSLWDVLVVAGDIIEGPARAIDWLESLTKKNVIFVPGNHEFYGTDIVYEYDILNNFALRNDSHVSCLFYGNSVSIDDVQFIGATLWTDFELYGTKEKSMQLVSKDMNDYYHINVGGKLLTPQLASEYHWNSRMRISNQLEHPYCDKKVIVTHHGIAKPSISAKYATGPYSYLNPAYISDMSEMLLKQKPNLAIHGHIHASMDYMIGDTRVVTNPHGYGAENYSFKPNFIVEI